MMNQLQVTRQNHYVPIWYQRRFNLGPRGTLRYLDLDPPSIELPTGHTIIGKGLRFRSPRQCFRKTDLYTTRFGGTFNDEVERFLLGRIDAVGAIAVRAVVGNDHQLIHKYFQRLFEYLNAQKLRTPKGLDWINSKYPSLSQIGLMREMQYLRQIHCTMWIECVREIVSAEKSDVKFIVTDHPVTAYNSACTPTSVSCQYPEEPSIGLKGTQTVFALDADHCLILTNLEYAQDPTGVDVLAPRKNARYSGQTATRTDTMIRTRILTTDEVVAINFLLKTRSRQYLAAYDEDWLFPETNMSLAWEDIATILLPPCDLTWQFAGQIAISYRDGSRYKQDAFGRTNADHHLLTKKAQLTVPSSNDPCGCGSGRRYRKCCINVRSEERPPWDVYSIRERNLFFCNAVLDILGLSNGKTWEDVRRELTIDQVVHIHQVLEGLWPEDTDLADLLPRPDRKVFRAVYMGLIDPRTIALSVIGCLAYFDEIVIRNPFPHPVHMNAEYSPTQSPEQHKSQVLKNVITLLTLQPFIDLGILHLVPDPVEFNTGFQRAMMGMLDERTGKWTATEEDMRLEEALARDDLRRMTLRLPEDELRRRARERDPEIQTDTLERTIAYMKEQLENDQFALLQPLMAGREGGDLHPISPGMSLELSLFVAHLTGSAIYTDQPTEWRQLHEHTSATVNGNQRPYWAPIAETLASRTLPIEGHPLINLEARQAGKSGRMRRIFRHIWNMAVTHGEDSDVAQYAKQIATRLESTSVRAGIEWRACSTRTGPSSRFLRRIELSAPDGGFNMQNVHRLLVTSGRANYIESVPIALNLTFESGQDYVFA